MEDEINSPLIYRPNLPSCLNNEKGHNESDRIRLGSK